MDPPLHHDTLDELQTIVQELHQIKRRLGSDHQRLEMMLRRRGFREIKYASAHHCVLPQECSAATQDTFYRLMKKYSFRIFLRDLIAYVDTPSPTLLTRYCSERIAQRYLDVLLDHGILRQTSPSNYSFVAASTPFFGDTLEWFVAQVIKREFGSPASWGLRLKHQDIKGDCDVIASIEENFAYIEVKSSPPKHIDFSEISAFWDRVQTLKPAIAIFLEDTHLRMKDKLVVMFETELQRRYGSSAQTDYPVQRLQNEIFSINHRVFITNTKPGLISNIGTCLKHFLESHIAS